MPVVGKWPRKWKAKAQRGSGDIREIEGFESAKRPARWVGRAAWNLKPACGQAGLIGYYQSLMLAGTCDSGAADNPQVMARVPIVGMVESAV